MRRCIRPRWARSMTCRARARPAPTASARRPDGTVATPATRWRDGERPEPNAMILEAGDTCWRTERASRAAVLIDMAAYFAAARAAFEKARRSIHILCWAFDPDTLFEPEPGGGGPPEGRIGPFLKRLAAERPELEVRILCRRSSLPIAGT